MKIVSTFLLILGGTFTGFSQEEPEFYYPFPIGDQWGFRSESGEWKEDAIYDTIFLESVTDGYLWAVRNNERKYGLVSNFEFDTLVPIVYDTLVPLNGGALVRKDNIYSYLDLFNKNKETKIGSPERVFVDQGFALLSDDKKTFMIRDSYTQEFPFPYVVPFTQDFYFEGAPFWLVSDENRFGLYKDRTPIIPCIAESIQPFNDWFLRYWIGYWVYVRVSDGKVIDPKGRRVQIYHDNLWKIYDQETKTSKLYENGIEKFADRFDDCFLLENDHFAVRKGVKTGLVSAGGVVMIPIEYEQISFLIKDRYKVLKDSLWYLVDEHGRFLNQTGFDQILIRDQGDQMVNVRQNNHVGIVDLSGKQILPCEFDEVALLDFMLIALKEERHVPFSLAGKKLSDEIYFSYFVVDGSLLLFVNKSEFDIYNGTGKLNTKPAFDIIGYEGVIKAYSSNNLELIILNEKSGIVEERQQFPGKISFVLKETEDRLLRWELTKDYRKSYLEENQLTGNFGFRSFWDSRMMVPAVYTETRVGDFDYLCVEQNSSKPFHLLDSVPLVSLFQYDMVSADNGSVYENNIPSGTFKDFGGDYTHLFNRVAINDQNRGKFSNGNKNQLQDLVFEEYHNGYVMYNQGGTLKLTKPAANSISLFDFYSLRNANYNLAFDKQTIPLLMDPNRHMIVSGGEWNVSKEYDENYQKKVNGHLLGGKFKELSAFSGMYFGNDVYVSRNIENGNVYWSESLSDTSVNERFSEVHADIKARCFEVRDFAKRTGTIHVSEPNFVFEPEEGKTFCFGRVIYEDTNGFTLRTIDDSLLIPAPFAEIQPFDQAVFRVKMNGNWLLYSKNGEKLSDLEFNAIEIVNNTYYEVLVSGKHLLLDKQFHAIADLETYKLLEGTLYQRETTDRYDLWNPVSGVKDSLANGEQLISNSVFLSGKLKGKIYVRKFGESEQIPLIGTGFPEQICEFIVSKGGRYYEAISREGELVVNRKQLFTDLKQGDSMLCFVNPKNWLLLNSQGKTLYSGKKGKSIYFNEGNAILEFENDLYGLTNEGKRCSVEQAMKAEKPLQKVEYNIQKEVSSDRFGVTNKLGRWIVQPNYQVIQQLSPEEFSVELEGWKGLMEQVKEELLPAEYDDFYLLTYETWLVRKGKKFGVFNRETGWIIPLN